MEKINTLILERGKDYIVERIEIKGYELDPKCKQKPTLQQMKFIDETEVFYIFEHKFGLRECIHKNTPSDQLSIKEIRRKH